MSTYKNLIGKPLKLVTANLNNDQAEKTFKISFVKYLHNKFLHFKNRNTKIQAKKNISYHYDLGNKFYRYWLDASMTYSSAIFSNQHDKLEIAQKNKYKKLADLSAIKNGDKILEIGCGWGGFSEFLGKNYDCDITAITISKEQFYFAKKRIKDANLSKKVTVLFINLLSRILSSLLVNKSFLLLFDEITLLTIFKSVLN